MKKILAFGDSLTSETYTLGLSKLLQNEASHNEKRIEVIRESYPGATTCYLEEAFRNSIKAHRPDIAAILAGTNDMGYALLELSDSDEAMRIFREKYPEGTITLENLMRSGNEIKKEILSCLNQEFVKEFLSAHAEHAFGHLKAMYSYALENNTIPIAMTIPSLRTVTMPDTMIVASRSTFNKMIKDYCTEENILCVDLCAATSDKETGLLLTSFTYDGLHLNAEGNLVMAKTAVKEGIQLAKRILRKWT